MTAADALERLHAVCVAEYARAQDDPSPDRKVGRKAILQAEQLLNAIPLSLPCEEFLQRAAEGLEALHLSYSRDDVGDPDGWGAGAVGAIENAVAELRAG